MKNCIQCNKPFEPFKTTQTVCGISCAIKYTKGREKREKAELKENLLTTSDLRKGLQIVTNSIVREIDKGCNCISCGKRPLKFNAGHFYSVGSDPSIRFHLFNIWGQCEHCNSYLSGNIHQYRNKLINEGIYEFIGDLPIMYPSLKLSKEELKEKVQLAKKILKSMPKLARARTFEERIELRKQINNQLNIYTI